MGIHMNLDYHEPPNGDFVVLIERMVGMPPSDPETAGRELSAQLRARAAARDEVNREELSDVHQPAVFGPPDITEVLESMAKTGVKGLFRITSRLLIIAGVTILLLTALLGMPVPFVEPIHGIVALIAGVILANANS